MGSILNRNIQSQLTTLRRQYFQLIDPAQLRWPDDAILKTPASQAWMFHNLFNLDVISYSPPEWYQLRVLKLLVSRIERAVVDPEEDEISDDIMSAFAVLLGANVPPESTAVQQKACVTYSYPLYSNNDDLFDDYTVTVLESRFVLASSATTGLRTWEASLLMAAFLTSEKGRGLVARKKIFELGAGSGMLSILCAKYLNVGSIVATDGDEGVVDALKTNIFINGLDIDSPNTSIIRTAALKWGWALNASSFAEDYGMEVPDVLLGADVTYDPFASPALVSSVREFFDLNPALQVLIAATIRNEQTFKVFQNACKRNGLSLELVDYPLCPEHLQDGPFYPTSIPIQIWRIARPQEARGPFSY